MIDKLGVELRIGDTVAFSASRTSIRIGVVQEIIPSEYKWREGELVIRNSSSTISRLSYIKKRVINLSRYVNLSQQETETPQDTGWFCCKKNTITTMRPYIVSEDMAGIGVGFGVVPVAGGMIAKDHIDPTDQWYISPEYFEANFERCI